MEFNIVVYGCDNSGKTTLARNLVTHLMEKANGKPIDFAYIHSLGPVETGKQLDFMYRETRKVDGNIVRVFDRFPLIEERVCGMAIRGRDVFYNDHTTRARMLGRIDLFIHCDPGIETVLNWGNREQMDGVKENAKEMYMGYKRIPYEFPECHLENRILCYNFHDDPFGESLAKKVWPMVSSAYNNVTAFKKNGGIT